MATPDPRLDLIRATTRLALSILGGRVESHRYLDGPAAPAPTKSTQEKPGEAK
jgi:hypothetical protein